MRASDHLADVLKDIFKDSKIAQKINLGRTKATAITKHVIGDCYFASLTELLKRRKFSILIDESTDIGNVKTLCIVVRFFDEVTQLVQTCFWKLEQIFSEQNRDFVRDGATVERLYSEVMKSISEAGVPLDNVVGFGSDGCNTMMGRHKVCVRERVLCVPCVSVLTYVYYSMFELMYDNFPPKTIILSLR